MNNIKDMNNITNNDIYTLSIHHLKVNNIIKSKEQLFSLYIYKQLFIYYCITYNNYNSVIKKVENIINYRNKYKLLLNNQCSLCYNNIIKQHSIQFKGLYNNKAVIYIEPSKAINFNPYYICQHLLMELDNALRELINSNIITNNTINNTSNNQIILVFNMKDNTTSLTNMKIAVSMYKILNNCYLNNIENIYVYNLNGLINFFTKLFSKSFNKKIICDKPLLDFVN
jgi:hypothetical protein